MPIKDRKLLKVGVKLIARYKGETYRATVIKTSDGLRIRREDGSKGTFKTVSGAAVDVRGGKSTTGWSFWSIDNGSESSAKPKAAKSAKPKATRKLKAERKPHAKKAKATKTTNARAEALAEEQAEVNKEVAQIKGGFENLEDGRYFCPGCMDSFATDTDEEPKTCPEGHTPVGAEEELAAVSD